MGQATVDLPDPMQSPAAPATAGTDDLLAQLAGDEIERLLAETDTERPAPAASAVLSGIDHPAARDATATAPLPPGYAANADASASVIPPDSKENLTSQLDALFDSLSDAATPPAPAPPPAAAAETPAAPSPTIANQSPANLADTASSSAELKALGESIPVSDAAAVSAEAAALADTITAGDGAEPDEDTRPSLLVRLMEFINFPLGTCSDPVRQAVGKIAIATLLNAIAVLAYTLVFRRH